jgi:ABC-2 type transport system permease protein
VRWRPYRAIVGVRFRVLLQYRVAAFAGVWTQVFFGLVFIMVYEAFYRSSTVTPPMPFAQLVSYVWLGQALFAMLPWIVEPEIRAMVRSGAVAYELVRPVDLYALWFARSVAHRTAPTILRAVPMVIITTVVLPLVGLPEWRLGAPAAPVSFAVTLVFALALASSMSTLLNISLLWTIAGEGIVMIAATLVAFCSGMIVPLPLFPNWLQAILTWLPFAGVVDLPYRVYSGDIPTAELALVLAKQLGWTVALIALGRALMARAMKRVVVQGG